MQQILKRSDLQTVNRLYSRKIFITKALFVYDNAMNIMIRMEICLSHDS